MLEGEVEPEKISIKTEDTSLDDASYMNNSPHFSGEIKTEDNSLDDASYFNISPYLSVIKVETEDIKSEEVILDEHEAVSSTSGLGEIKTETDSLDDTSYFNISPYLSVIKVETEDIKCEEVLLDEHEAVSSSSDLGEIKTEADSLDDASYFNISPYLSVIKVETEDIKCEEFILDEYEAVSSSSGLDEIKTEYVTLLSDEEVALHNHTYAVVSDEIKTEYVTLVSDEEVALHNHTYAVVSGSHTSDTEPSASRNYEEKQNRDGQFSCPYCDYSGATEACIIIHIMAAHTIEEKPSPYECEGVLSIDFERDSDSYSTVQYSLSCSYCDYKTLHPSALRIHNRFNHTTDIFSCSYCDYSNLSSSRLNRHIKAKHTKAQPRSDSYCDCKSVEPSALQVHNRFKHTTDIFSCSYCDYSTLWSSYLKRHMAKHTKALPHSVTKSVHPSHVTFKRSTENPLSRPRHVARILRRGGGSKMLVRGTK